MNQIENVFEEQLMKLSRIFRPERVFFGVLILFGAIIIALSNGGGLPLSSSYLLFYGFLLVLFGIYRPELLWLAVVFFLPFELAIVGEFSGFEVRAYQLGSFALLIATVAHMVQGKIRFFRIRWFDGLLSFIFIGAVLSYFANGLPQESVGQIAVILSFGLIYALGRIFLRSKEEVDRFLSALLLSGVVVSGYALYQMIAFQNFLKHFMVMPGRPNSTFQEADWLGFFIGMVALVSYVRFLKTGKRLYETGLFFLLALFVTVLIITVSRSAWLGFLIAAGSISLLLLVQSVFEYFTNRQKEAWIMGKIIAGLPLVLLLSLSIIFTFNLTRFELDQRFVSSGTGDQVITVACKDGGIPPENITSIEELPTYRCQHINLEDKEQFEGAGYTLATTKRPDPNIEIRQSIYSEALEIIQSNPIFGIGWGKSLQVFGQDERGAGLNSSNIFLETWLGSGLLGFIGLVFFFALLLWAALKRHFRKRDMTEGFWFGIMVIAFSIHVLVFNLFNAGLFLATFTAFLFFASWYLEKTVPHITSLWQK